MEYGYFEIDSFLENPNYVRDNALRQYYSSCNYLEIKSLYPGYRTSNIDLKIKEEIKSKLEKIYNRNLIKLNCFFAYVTHESMFGIPHVDPYSDVSGIIYLSLEPIENSGTTIFNGTEDDIAKKYVQHYRSKIEILYNKTVKPTNNIKKQIAEEILSVKNSFEVVKTFSNKFNKGVFYSGKYLHSADNYFGDTIENSRMTLNIFGNFDAN